MKKQRKLEILKLLEIPAGNIWSHPKGSRGGKDMLDDVCEYCGKKVGGKTNTKFVHILTSGQIVPAGIDELEIDELWRAGILDSGSQGAFALGSECAKKLLGNQINKF